MPVARRYGPRQVGTAALPGVRRTSAETALSRGAGLELERARTAQTIGQAAGAFAGLAADIAGRIAEEERRRADQAAVLEGTTQLDDFETLTMYGDGKTPGVLGLKGKAVFEAPEQVKAEYDALTARIEQGLSTDRQREAWARIKADRWQSMAGTVHRHVAQEIDGYERGQLLATIDSSTSLAHANALDPRRVGKELTRAVTAAKDLAARQGLSPEASAAAIQAVASKVHVGVINNLLAHDRTREAAAYFAEARDEIAGDAHDDITRALEETGLRARAQAESDRILAGGGTLSEQREQARQIDDPKLRDDVMARLEHEAVVRDRAEREADEARLRNVYDIVDQSHDVTTIPPAEWARLSGSERSALRGYAQALARGVPVQTDLVAYYGLMRQAAEDPDAFATRNLLEFRAKLDEVEFKQLAGLQLSMRSGQRGQADKDLDGFRTATQVVNDTLDLYGIDAGDKDNASAVAQLRRMLDRRVETFAATTGRKPSNQDMQDMLDGLLSQSTTTPGSWWSFLPGGAPFFDRTTRLLDTRVGDIPAAERRQIEDALTKAGRPVSDATVLDLYLETRVRMGGAR